MLSDYQECFNLVEDLKLAAGRYKKFHELNIYEREKNPHTFKKAKIYRKCCCFTRSSEDAEELYANEIQDLKIKLQRLEKKKSQSNLGICYVVFREIIDAKNCNMNLLTPYMRKKVSIQHLREMNFDSWSIKPAYLQSDIIWPNIGSNSVCKWFKRLIFFALIFFVSIILLTPTYAL